MSTHVAGGRPQVLAGGWVRHFPATWVSPSAAHTWHLAFLRVSEATPDRSHSLFITSSLNRNLVPPALFCSLEMISQSRPHSGVEIM